MKMKILAGLVAAVVVAAAVVGGVALAQGDDDKDGKGAGGAALYERAAAILGVDAGDLEDALRQAKSEMADERLAAYLDKLVEEEVIDRAEADEYLEWHRARPEDLPGFLGRKSYGGKKHGFKGRGFHMERFSDEKKHKSGWTWQFRYKFSDGDDDGA